MQVNSGTHISRARRTTTNLLKIPKYPAAEIHPSFTANREIMPIKYPKSPIKYTKNEIASKSENK